MIDNIEAFTGEEFPEYLRSYDALSQYFRSQLNGLSTAEKGDRFAHAVAKLVPQTDAGMEFDTPSLNSKKSRDGGIDLIANAKKGQRNLYIQAKLWIDRAEDIDAIISKFESYLNDSQKASGEQLSFDFDKLDSSFMVVTLSPLKNILANYEKKGFSSKGFYHQNINLKSLYFVDGYQILFIMRAAYSKINKVNTKFTLNLATDFIHKDNVFIGTISSISLKNLYEQVGDALFFENIRDFLGAFNQERTGRKTPNLEIINTITNDATKMLARNNGIVFSASKVDFGDNTRQLILHNGSVVNGCQTTMCLVEHAQQECYVLVKIVEISQSWDIATAANYQNSVADIDLELAQYLRPQLAKRAAALSGVQIHSTVKSPFQIIEEIYDRKVAYDEIRLIYIGLFSKTPNNIFSPNYTELLQTLLNKFHEGDPYGAKTLEILFALQIVSQKGLKRAQNTFKDPSYANKFERIYKEESLSYRCFISILTLCGFLDINIADRKSDTMHEYKRMTHFFAEAQKKLTNNEDLFVNHYVYAVKVWMQEIDTGDNPAEIQRDMYRRSRSLNFSTWFRKLCMERDMQNQLYKIQDDNNDL